MSKLKFTTAAIHGAFWILYVVLELVANYPHLDSEDHRYFIEKTILSLPVLMIPTYFIALVAVPRLLLSKKWTWFLVALIVAAVFAYWARLRWLNMVNYLYFDFVGSMPLSKVLKNVIRDYSVIALAVCIYIIGDWRKKEKENEKLIKAKAETELQLLKRQLHPHFLFNTLNNIYSLALKESGHENETVKAILKLSSLMEYLVYQAGEIEVKLQEELDLVRDYMDLEVMRYGPELQVERDIDPKVGELRIAPLVLLPFVENCFKHGGRNEKEVFWIRMKIKKYDQLLTVQISNSKGHRKRNSQNGGVGLVNIRERLQLLYPGRHQLEIEDNEAYFSIKLELKT